MFTAIRTNSFDTNNVPWFVTRILNIYVASLPPFQGLIYGAWYLAMLDYLSQSFYNYNSMKLEIMFSANDSRSWYICYCISYSWETSQRKKIRQYFLLLKIPYLTINVYSQLNKILSGWNHGSYLFRTFGWISPLYLCQLWYLFNKQRGANINKVHWSYRKSISFQ